jgi:hypothetical protein
VKSLGLRKRCRAFCFWAEKKKVWLRVFSFPVLLKKPFNEQEVSPWKNKGLRFRENHFLLGTWRRFMGCLVEPSPICEAEGKGQFSTALAKKYTIKSTTLSVGFSPSRF